MRILQFIGALLIFFATPAIASSGSAAWIVAQKSGDVRVVRNGMQAASLNARAALSPGDVVATGANGRAMLTRGNDYVVVAPSSRLLLPKEEQQKGFTRLIQQVGTMLYKVRHTGVPHFAVETPMLAAVVKGTSFTVIVEDNRAAVQVTEGLVEVSSATGSARRLVEKGMTVYVGRERPDTIIEMKPGMADIPASDSDAVKIETSGEVPLTTITNLTGGLVRATPTAPVVAVANPQSPAVVATPISDGSTPVVEVVDASAPTTVAPVAGNVESAVTGIARPVAGLVQTTAPAVIAPVTDTITTVTAPVVDTVTTVTAPVIDTVTTVTAPVVDTVTTVAAPVVNTVATVTAPVIDTVTTVAAPVIDTVTIVAAPVIDTVTSVTTPVVNTVTTVAAPVIDTVTTVTAPVVETVTTVAAPIVTPVVETVTPVVAPVVNTVAPVINTVTPVVAPVVAPLAPIVQPVVNTVPILGSLLRF